MNRDAMAERWAYNEWLKLFGEDLIREGVEVPVNVAKIQHSARWEHLRLAFKSGWDQAIEEVLQLFPELSKDYADDRAIQIVRLIRAKIKSLKEPT